MLLILKNIHKINGYSLNVKGKGYYFKGWDNTTSEVTHFSIREVSSPSIQIKNITLYKEGCKWLGDGACYVYGIEVDGKINHYSRERLKTPAAFRDTIEEILNK